MSKDGSEDEDLQQRDHQFKILSVGDKQLLVVKRHVLIRKVAINLTLKFHLVFPICKFV